jgi:FkbM family methyltransferase
VKNSLRLRKFKSALSRWIRKTPFQYIPVIVLKGLAKGARWTAFPESSYWRGTFEPDVQKMVERYGCRRGGCCWDLGAHFGVYTVGMAMAVGPEGEVVGFEPDPVSFKRLQLHVKRNSLEWARLYNVAVSDSEGFSEILLYEGAGTTTTHLAYEDEDVSKVPVRLKVPLVMLDALVERKEIRPPQFIKIDVEGHGARALGGAVKTLTTFKPTIVMSFHSAQEVQGTRRLLEPRGYKAISFEGQEVSWPKDNFRDVAIFAAPNPPNKKK